MSKNGVISVPYFPAFGLNTERYFVYLSVFSLNAGKYGPEVTPFLDTFHAVFILTFNLKKEKQCKKNVLVYYGNDFLSNN